MDPQTRMDESEIPGKVIGARVTRAADWWFIVITVEVPDKQSTKRPAAIGIDVGLNRLATLSTGEEYENQAFLKTALGSSVKLISGCIAGNMDQ